MPGYLLHFGATVQCLHQGLATPNKVDGRVKVSGAPVVTFPATYQVAGCALPPPTAGNGPCVTAVAATCATRVFVDGAPVLLQDSQALCAPTGTPWQITAVQTRVFGV